MPYRNIVSVALKKDNCGGFSCEFLKKFSFQRKSYWHGNSTVSSSGICLSHTFRAQLFMLLRSNMETKSNWLSEVGMDRVNNPVVNADFQASLKMSLRGLL